MSDRSCVDWFVVAVVVVLVIGCVGLLPGCKNPDRTEAMMELARQLNATIVVVSESNIEFGNTWRLGPKTTIFMVADYRGKGDAADHD
jgi:hypothetical protein